MVIYTLFKHIAKNGIFTVENVKGSFSYGINTYMAETDPADRSAGVSALET